MSAGTGNLPNQNMDFVPLATLPAADLDKLVDNIEALADGTGIGDGSVVTANIADNAVTAAKSTELVAGTRRQGNATGTDITDPVIKYGWAQLTATTNKTQTYTVTFAEAFDNVPIITTSIAGYKTAGATDVNAGNSLTADVIPTYAEAISTTGFTIRAIAAASGLPNVALLVCWIAVGSKAR